jgi:hypothetical protein
VVSALPNNQSVERSVLPKVQLPTSRTSSCLHLQSIDHLRRIILLVIALSVNNRSSSSGSKKKSQASKQATILT